MEEENTITSRDHTAATTATTSPPSPSHEFSFTIPLDANTNKPESQEPPTAIDLAPADDIFFHGHLLPLHLLRSLPVSPRASTHSLDDSSLPIRRRHDMGTCICNNSGGRTKGQSFNSHEYEIRRSHFEERRVKSKSFSVLSLDRRPKIESTEDHPEKHKWKLRFDVSHFVKKYIRMFTKSSREDIQLRKQPYSFSGKLSPIQGKLNLRGRRGEFSAPASMRTSPTNSGIIKPTTGAPPPSSDSTMEELQAAIQAAIAHCKNSSATV